MKTTVEKGQMLRFRPGTSIEDFFSSSLWFAVLTLMWGYICVGIGFAVYKILKNARAIKDETSATALPLHQAT